MSPFCFVELARCGCSREQGARAARDRTYDYIEFCGGGVLWNEGPENKERGRLASRTYDY